MEFLEDTILLIAVCSLQFLLDEARAMLIATEFDHMTIYVLQIRSQLENS